MARTMLLLHTLSLLTPGEAGHESCHLPLRSAIPRSLSAANVASLQSAIISPMMLYFRARTQRGLFCPLPRIISGIKRHSLLLMALFTDSNHRPTGVDGAPSCAGLKCDDVISEKTGTRLTPCSSAHFHLNVRLLSQK